MFNRFVQAVQHLVVRFVLAGTIVASACVATSQRDADEHQDTEKDDEGGRAGAADNEGGRGGGGGTVAGAGGSMKNQGGGGASAGSGGSRTGGAAGESAGGASAGKGGIAAGNSGGSAGSTGGAMQPASSSLCSGKTLPVCDGFDGTKWLAGWMSEVQGGGTVLIDSTKSKRGGGSLHVTAKNTKDGGAWLNLALPQSMRTGHFGRADVFFNAPAPYMHADIVGTVGKESNRETVWRYGIEAQNWTVNYYASGAEGALPSDRFEPNRPYVFPTGRWFCMEWQFDFVGNLARLWIDGTEVSQLHKPKTPSWPGPDADRTWLGYHMYQRDEKAAVENFDLWFDDLGLDIKRIGCQ